MLALLLLSLATGSVCTDISSETTIDGFISEIQDTLDDLRYIAWIESKSDLRSITYSLTDSVTIRDRQIQLKDYCISVYPDTKYIRIFSGVNFLMDIHYDTNETVPLHANLKNINAEPGMSGTDTMLFLHHILIGLGVKSCSLRNCARILYSHYPNSDLPVSPNFAVLVSIPLISLRTICGHTTDWYSNFGYHNANVHQITAEMKRIHDIPVGNTTLGPHLLKLWNQADKTEFQREYELQEWQFSSLLKLRDGARWFVYFKE